MIPEQQLLQQLLAQSGEVKWAQEAARRMSDPDFILVSTLPRHPIRKAIDVAEADHIVYRDPQAHGSPHLLSALQAEEARGGTTVTVHVIGFPEILYDVFVSDRDGSVLAIAVRSPPIVLNSGC